MKYSPRSSLRRAAVVLEQSAQALVANDRSCVLAEGGVGLNDLVVEPLVVALRMIVLDKSWMACRSMLPPACQSTLL